MFSFGPYRHVRKLSKMTNNVAADNSEEPTEYVSMKFLLKQVYAAHSAKVKELESEIKKLKQELKISQNAVLACQKCKEMESAYSACKEEYKNAVLEQTRRLQELELKFSAIECKKKSPSSQETEKPVILHETRPYLMPDTLSQSFTLPDTELEPSEKINKPLRYSTSAVALDSIENILESPSHFAKPESEKKQNCGISALTKNFLSSARKSNGSLIDDDVVLVPDTMDLSRSPIKSNNGTPKNVNVGKENKDVEIEKSCTSKKRAFSDGSSNIIKASKPSRMSEEISVTVHSMLVDPIPTSVLNNKRKKLEKQGTGPLNNFNGLVCNSTSSLSINEQPIKKDDSNILSDDDFQSSDVNTDESRSAGWKVSNKKNSQKKQSSIRGIKATSHFKMTLEAPPENFKKPNYKQTKLSKSIFQPQKKSAKDVLSNQGSCNKDEVHEKDAAECLDMNSPLNETSFACLSELASLANGDISHIQDSLLLMGAKNLSNYSETSSPLEICAEEDEGNDDHEESVFLDDVPPIAEDDQIENGDSFDRLPIIAEPNYKYKEDAVRGKAKRKELKGFDCKDCEKYYGQLGLSEEEKKERLKQCSRHRAKYVPPSTPDHFWELDFPDTEECKARGYQAETQKVQLKTRRRRPL